MRLPELHQLCNVAAGADGVQIVPAVLCQHTDLKEVQDVVDAEDAQKLTKAAVDGTAQTKGQEQQMLNSDQNQIFDCMEHRRCRTGPEKRRPAA